MAQFVSVLERVHHYQRISLATEKLFKTNYIQLCFKDHVS